MKFRIRFADQIVGLFILLAILGLAGALILLGINQRWFAKNYRFYTEFKSGSGLKVAMPITFKGFQIGKVDSMEINHEKQRVLMNFHIFEEFYENVVLENSVIELATSPIGIGGGLFFHRGTPDFPSNPPLAEGEYVPSLDFEEGIEMVRQGKVQKTTGDDSIGSLVGNIGPILEKVDAVLYSINEVTMNLNEAIKGGPEGNKTNQLGSLLHSTDSLITSIDDIVTGRDEGPVGNMLNNVSATSETLSASIEKITKDLTALAQDLRKITGNVERMTSLDEGNPLYKHIDDMLVSIKGIIGELEDFAGFVSGTAPQISGILEEGRAALAKSQDVMEALKNNPLLSGGVPIKQEQPSTIKGYRDEEF